VWSFAQSIQDRPTPQARNPRAQAQANRAELEKLATYSTRHAAELHALSSAESRARHERELLQWAASISTQAEEKFRALEGQEALETSGWRHANPYRGHRAKLTEWSEADHPRQPAGTSEGGEFAPKEGGTAGSTPKSSTSPPTVNEPAQATPKTKTHLPAAHRGTWVSGTKGDGVFRYNDSPKNQEAGLASKEVRFANQHIAVGGFPPEAYYGGDAGHAGVEIGEVTWSSRVDGLAADAAMREKLGDPNWERPEGYRWNHAGDENSKIMELVHKDYHRSVAHKGSGASPRAARRIAKGRGTTGLATGVLTVYLATRDALQTFGALQPDYPVAEHEVYHFHDKDGSTFVVVPGGWFSSAKREYIAGPRKGQSETITNGEVEQHRRQAEAEFGKYIPGTIFKQPRFIPGKQRKTLPLVADFYGVRHETGWIDQDGVHYYVTPQPLPQ